MVRDGAHGVVGYACRICATDPSWVGEKRVKAAIAPL